MELIDIGINLTHDDYGRDRAAVLERAAAAGVVQMVVTGASLGGSRAAIELAAAHPGRLYATAGVHPHHARELGTASPDDLRELEELSARAEVVAIGECGLDYFRDLAPRPAQRAAFTRQLELAVRVAKPVFLHQRDAHEDFVAIVREFLPALVGGVAHCFTGTGSQLESYLDMGLHVGITGWICDERRGSGLKPLMREVPAERLMIETDGPYLLPRDLDPKPASRRNEPAFLPHVADVVARARGEPLEVLAATTTATARRFFRLAVPAPATVSRPPATLIIPSGALPA